MGTPTYKDGSEVHVFAQEITFSPVLPGGTAISPIDSSSRSHSEPFSSHHPCDAPRMLHEAEIVVYPQYCPPEVQRVIASGSSAFIGEVDASTVLKYPLAHGADMSRLEVERKLLEVVGHHRRIIGLKRFSNSGLYLERAINGNLADYILESVDSPPSLQQRLSWCQEAAEAVAWIHSRRVLHCDIQPANFLLDEEFHLKLSDFQGKHLSENGTVLLDGGSGEPCRFYCPREDPFEADTKTDLFALGCTIYFIMMGHPVFPDIVDGEDGWYEKVNDRFTKHQFPQDVHVCSEITLKCWLKGYESASDLVQDLESVRMGLSDTGCT